MKKSGCHFNNEKDEFKKAKKGRSREATNTVTHVPPLLVVFVVPFVDGDGPARRIEGFVRTGFKLYSALFETFKRLI